MSDYTCEQEVSMTHLSFYADLVMNWIDEILVRHILSLERQRLRPLSQLAFMQYVNLCVIRLFLYLLRIVIIFVLNFIIIIRSKIWIHGFRWYIEQIRKRLCLWIWPYRLLSRKMVCGVFLTVTKINVDHHMGIHRVSWSYSTQKYFSGTVVGDPIKSFKYWPCSRISLD